MADAPAVAAKRPAKTITQVVIEISNEKNWNLQWSLTHETLRGSWKRQNLVGSTPSQDMAKMPDLPGQCVLCDPSRQYAKVFDPLNEPRNKELCDRASAICKVVLRENFGPARDVERTKLGPDEIKSWLWYMRKAVDAGMARVIHGELPTDEEICDLPGKRQIELHNSSSQKRQYYEDPDPAVRATVVI